MRIVLPLPANRANARWHWRKEKSLRDSYMTLATVQYPKRPPTPIDPARVSAEFYLWNEMDTDNLIARLKWPLDWLVARQIIVDDKPDHLQIGPVAQLIDRKNQRLVLTVEAA